MKNLLCFIVGLTMFASGANASEPTCNDIKGTWRNELGSLLVITKVNSGAIAGTYANYAALGSPVNLVGWVNTTGGTNYEKVVSFSVNWGSYGSVTSWSGTCSSNTIKTIWNLARTTSNQVWSHIVTNSDTFTPIEPQARDIDAGPIWNNADAETKCPTVCSSNDLTWKSQWRTTIPNKMSVCGCE